MSLLGKQIRLNGISQKGKNRIREFGNRWFVIAETESVLFSSDKKGPWLFITPEGCDQSHKGSRWIHANNDSDFTFMAIE